MSGGSFDVEMDAVFLQIGGVMGLETARMIQMKLVVVSETTVEQLFFNIKKY